MKRLPPPGGLSICTSYGRSARWPANLPRCIDCGCPVDSRSESTTIRGMSAYEAADFYNLDELLPAEDRALRDKVRAWVEARYMPLVQKCTRAGTFPLELAP